MPSQYENFRAILAEMFQLDRADLDFGIYRIMNQKRGDIERFLENDLLPQVQKSFRKAGEGDQASLQFEINKNIEQARELGVDPESIPKIKELKAKYAHFEASTEDTQNEIFSHLAHFFARYYKGGDFLSLPRYKKGVYAIPYEGEEVKLHWANADQYYIKSSENFRDYAFTIGDAPARVHFKLADADTESNNNKSAKDANRRFALASPSAPVTIENGELIAHFHYAVDADKRGQAQINAETSAAILAAAAPLGGGWAEALATPAPTGANPGRTVVDKHLADYTARNSSDYFIHKDLGGFLRRELDFFIKNEIMELDDIQNQTLADVEKYLGKIRVIREIAHKIIEMLAHLEDFQKKLWLKKKFVVETGWCVTLDRVPASLYPEIAANAAQHNDWLTLFAIDEIAPSTINPGYTNPLTTEFLAANPHLVLDTKHYGPEFTQTLLAAFDDLDAQTDGLLINSENFQALSLLQTRYKEQIKCIYIDPPYNTGLDGFAYKDNYQHSSWLSMMENRLALARRLMPEDAAIFVSIDDDEQAALKRLMDSVFGAQNFVANVIWQKKYAPQNDAKWFSDDHDFIVTYAQNKQVWRPGRLARGEAQNKAYSNPDNDPRGPWRADNYKSNKSADERPNLFYAIIQPQSGEELWPQHHAVWRYTRDQHQRNIADNRVWWGQDGSNRTPAFKRFLTEVGDIVSRTIWQYGDVGHNQDAIRELRELFVTTSFTSPKPTRLIRRVVDVNPSDNVVDFFAGSGTTGHAVIAQNREDEGSRKYILVEMGEYFETVLKPRIMKVVYSKDWKDGKPVSRVGSSHLFKYMRLESYEDTLNNLELNRTREMQLALDHDDTDGKAREEYWLRYHLDIESRGSASLLNLEKMERPWSYELKVAAGSAGRTWPVPVDLVETFNYLIGLAVEKRETVDGVAIVRGRVVGDGTRVLALWRDVEATPNSALENWWRAHGAAAMGEGAGVQKVYVNGDNTLGALRAEGETWEAELTEAAFHQAMWDVKDVE